MTDVNIKVTNPQKYYLKLLSRVLFYLGFGSFWYEEEKTSYPRLYAIWCVAVNSYIVVVVFDELLVYIVRPDLYDGETHEFIEIGVGQTMVVIKFYIMMLHRQSIRNFLKRLLEEHRDIFTSSKLERHSVRKAKRLIYVFYIGCFSYLTMAVGQWVIVHFREGTTLKTQTTYFPTRGDVGFPFDLLRVLIILHWWLLVTMLVTSDCFCIMSIMFVANKFKQVQLYFEIMREKSKDEWRVEDFNEAVVRGIKLHQNALWCAKNVQRALGKLYGVQICESIVLLGICLLRLAILERTLANFVANLLYMVSLTLVTGCYMINSGDITYEALEVSTAIFHCGWECRRIDKSLRTLLIVAIHQAQQPVYMTAFGVINLSYESFISVLRSAYSFFAVVY